jgi:hypothetical protein
MAKRKYCVWTLRLRPEGGSDKTAQGNALGNQHAIIPLSPERAGQGQTLCLNPSQKT